MEKPEKQIFVCASFRVSGEAQGACKKKGANSLLGYLESELSDRGMDGVTVSATACLKACDRGPVMIVSTGVMLFGLLMTLFTSLWLIFAGMLLFSAGFFAAHSVASSWIGPRAKRAKGQASSLYLFSYYLGSSIAGTLGGVFWHSYGWNGVGGFIALMLVLALLVGARLHHRLHV